MVGQPKMQPGNPSHVNPNVGQKKSVNERKKARMFYYFMRALTIAIASLISTENINPKDFRYGATREEPYEENLPNDKTTNKNKVPEKKTNSEIKLKDKAMLDALSNIEKNFGVAEEDKSIIILQTPAAATKFCTFNDKWARTSKKELEVMYKYIDEKMKKDPEAQKVLLENILNTLNNLKKEMEEGLLTRMKAKKIPTTKIELDSKINDFVNSPATKESSCGFGFNVGFSLLGVKGSTQIQKLVVDFIKTLASSISQDLNSSDENIKNIARERYVTLITLIERARQIKVETGRK